MKRASRADFALSLVLGSLLTMLAAPAVALAGEFPVCTRTGNQTDPAISGTKVVYTDGSPGANHYQVYVYDIATKTEQAVASADTWTQDWAAIDGNVVAYVYYKDGKLPWQVYSRDLSMGAAQAISPSPDSQLNVCVSSGVFVWTQGNQIYRKRPADVAPVALTTVAKSYESDDSLSLDGERVAFACRNNVGGASHDLGVVSLSGGAITWLRVDPGKTLDASNPDVSGDRVVWQDNRNGNYDIYLYDFGTGQERRLTTAATNQTDPAISGDRVVFLDKTVNDAQSYVYVYDIATGATRRLNTAGSAYEPDLDGDLVVWWDTRVPGAGGDYNIYGYDLSVPDTFTKWTKRTSGTGEALLGVDFVSSKVGWVVGYGGTVLKSTDAGVTWKPQTSGTTVELTDIDMLDATTGWIVGYDRPNNAAVVLKTTNGGATWTPQSHYAPVGSWMTDVLAVDTSRAIGFAGGVALGQNLVWTQDGGATAWVTHPSAPAGTNLTGVSHLLGGIAWGVGAQSGLIKTTDSGATWAKVAHPTNGQERYTGVVALDANVAVVVGDDAPTTEATGLIMRTPDGGGTWTSPTAPTTRQLREVDGKGGHLWIVGEGGTIYHSRDAGVTWGKQTSPVTAELWNIDYRGPDLICAVGLNGTILTGMRPTATLGRPVAPASVKRGAYFTVTGTLKPRHSGSTPLTFYRKKSGKWVKYKTVNAKNADYSTYTKYKLKYKVPYTGSWYVVASHSCTDHRASVSAKENLSVK